MNKRLLAMASLGLCVACIPPSGQRTYRVDQTYAVKALLEEGRRPGPEAHLALADTKTIAFYPPDSCNESGRDKRGSSDVMRMQCGVLMSELEAEATRAGFAVVSWQTLRGPQRPIDYAKQNQVDILFEINELGFDIPTHQVYSRSEISFSDESKGTPVVLANPRQVAQRCITGFEKSLPPPVAVTLDMKMVSVTNGRVHWYYRTTRSDRKGGGSLTLSNRYRSDSIPFQSTGTSTWQTIVSAILWGGGIASGATFGLVDLIQPTTNEETGEKFDVPNVVHILNVGAIAGGLYWFISNGNKARPVYPPPETVLCHPGSLVSNSAPTRGPSGQQSGSSVVFEERVDVGRDPVAERRKALLVEVVRAFMEDVKAVKRGE